MQKHIISYFNGIKYSCFTSDNLEQFMQDKVNSGLSAKYVNDMVIIIKSAAKWAEKAHHYCNKIFDVELLKNDKKETVTITPSHQKQFLNSISENNDLTSIGVYCLTISNCKTTFYN